MRLLRTMSLVLAIVFSGTFAFGQATVNSTTLSTAVTSTSATSITVATVAATVAVNDIAYVDREAMLVTAISGTTLSVQRGVEGTRSATHATSSTIYIDQPDYFYATEVSGSCTATSETALPHIVLVSGNIYDCFSSVWTRIERANYVFEGATEDAFETTLAITDPTADATITFPVTGGNVRTWDNAGTDDVSIVFEGATADAFETTLTVTDPTADRTYTFADVGGTVMVSSLATNGPDIANSVWGTSNNLAFEGATADAFEVFITPADATADRTVTLADAGGTVMLSSLATNAPDAANSVYGTSNNLAFEGATADAFETFITVTDPSADRTFTLPDAASGTFTIQTGATITLTDVDLDTTDNSIAANVCEDQAAVTATGIATTDNVIWTMTSSDLSANFSISHIVPSAANQVTIRVCNETGGALDPGAVADFRLVPIQ